jgi:hypothetical protein
MKAIETTATINDQGQLSLDFPLEVSSWLPDTSPESLENGLSWSRSL